MKERAKEIKRERDKETERQRDREKEGAGRCRLNTQYVIFFPVRKLYLEMVYPWYKSQNHKAAQA